MRVLVDPGASRWIPRSTVTSLVVSNGSACPSIYSRLIDSNLLGNDGPRGYECIFLRRKKKEQGVIKSASKLAWFGLIYEPPISFYHRCKIFVLFSFHSHANFAEWFLTNLGGVPFLRVKKNIFIITYSQTGFEWKWPKWCSRFCLPSMAHQSLVAAFFECKV